MTLEPVNKKVTVRVAASTANLGGGFDCLGLALGLYHTVTAAPAKALRITDDAGAPTDRYNLIYESMNAVFERFGHKDMPVELTSHSDIPLASGLGSSASCVVAGVAAANAMLGSPLGESDIIDLCARLEGHPDNVLPAIIGGVTACCENDGHIIYTRADVPPGLICAIATPDFPLSTAKARSVLPDSYTRADCVYSLSRAAVTFGALASGNFAALSAVDDRLHQPYRIPLISGYDEVRAALMSAGAVSCCISGAGPSVLAFFTSPAKPPLPAGWTLRLLDPVNAPVDIKVE